MTRHGWGALFATNAVGNDQRAMPSTKANDHNSLIQGDRELVGELLGIEGAAGEIATVDFDGRHFAAAIIYAQDQVLGFGIFVYVNFLEGDATFPQELLGVAAV